MRRRGALLGGLVAFGWLGCAAVAGLDDIEIVPTPDAAAGDARVAAEATTPPPSVDSSTSIVDASTRDADAGATAVDAGPCGLCPRGTAHALCVANVCTPTYRVFVTTAGFAANFGGATGGDAKCQEAAAAAQLGGTWKAWVSDTTESTTDRFTKAPVMPVRLLDGTMVVSANTDLFEPPANPTGTLLHAIDLDEQNAAPDQLEVWTGTDPGGLKGSNACNAWTSNFPGDTAIVGNTTRVDSAWTDIYRQTCDRTTQHLYCFEQ